MASDFGSCIEHFLCSVNIDVKLPPGFSALQPYGRKEVRTVVKQFCQEYYSGSHLRLGLWGINPGRFGAGITGICFTDPHALTAQLGIASTLAGKRELSAEFVSMVIDAYGGPHKFYHDVYLGALSPIGFVRDAKNINFYDDKNLAGALAPFITECVQYITSAGLLPDKAIFLGRGSLRKYVDKQLTSVFGTMKTTALDHPRFIMQYKRSMVKDYVKQYVDTIAVYSQS